MGYYLVVKTHEPAEIHTSWASAKAATQGVKGAWCKSYDTREAAAAALASLASSKLSEDTKSVAVYVDGSALLGRWSGCAVWFGDHDPRNLAKDLPPPHTSPRAELQAVVLALDLGVRDAIIYSDNAFVVQAYQRGWPATFAHADLMAELRSRATEANVRVSKVAGHSGILGNEAADALVGAIRPK